MWVREDERRQRMRVRRMSWGGKQGLVLGSGGAPCSREVKRREEAGRPTAGM
jgi:hypothetical protein